MFSICEVQDTPCLVALLSAHLRKPTCRGPQAIRILGDWLATTNRKPLILRGARRVGKSTLVRLFAERCERPLAEVNLERHADLGPAFARNDPAHLLNVLETLPGIGPIGADGLLFLDEIQSVPQAIPALRYFREDMSDLPVLAAGSLLDFVLADHRLSMPVGRSRTCRWGR